MSALYVSSLHAGAGKTLVCAGLGRLMQADGKRVGFFKPIILDIKAGEKAADSDAAFLKQVLDLAEPPDSLCPAINDRANLGATLEKAYARVSPDKDVVIVEGVWRQQPGGRHFETACEVASGLYARVIMVEPYADELPETSLASYRAFGERLIGIIINRVPRSRLALGIDQTTASLKKAGIPLLGVLPDDRMLAAPTVAELAAEIGGEIINRRDGSDELVENLMLGALTPDSGVDYFESKANKAALLRGDRPDMQLAALETSTRCLVLTGGVAPHHRVLYKADDRGVPVVLTQGDTVTTVNSIETVLGGARFHQAKKLPALTALMRQHLDLQALYQALGLAG